MILSLILALSLPAAAQAPEALDRSKLLAMKRSQLDELYKTLKSGPLPDGMLQGSGSLAPGEVPGAITQPIGWLAWRGKKFNRAKGTLVNVGPFGMEYCEAKVYYGPSNLDGAESIIIDYTQTTCLIAPVVRTIRDEIRQAGPGLYFGYAYSTAEHVPTVTAIFALETAR